jgi:hypothetical protein
LHRLAGGDTRRIFRADGRKRFAQRVRLHGSAGDALTSPWPVRIRADSAPSQTIPRLGISKSDPGVWENRTGRVHLM